MNTPDDAPHPRDETPDPDRLAPDLDLGKTDEVQSEQAVPPELRHG